jgi:hypothetical protein
MTDKNIGYCRWEESNSELLIHWESTLSTGDKDILDVIISDLFS